MDNNMLSTLTHREFPKSITDIAIYNSSHVTTEIACSLLNAITKVRPDSKNVYITDCLNYNSDSVLYILICPLGLIHKGYIAKPIYYITYQLESYMNLNNANYLVLLNGALYNWDYSYFNICKINDTYKIESEYVCPGFTDNCTTSEIVNGNFEYTDDGRNIDVLFLGWDIHPRRRDILTRLSKAKLNVSSVTGLDINGMKDIIRRSKICINIHSVDNFVLETIRLNVLLSNMSCIVSETSEDVYAMKLYNESDILWSNVEKFVEDCSNLVNNFDERKLRATNNYKWYSTNRKWNDIVDFDKLLPLSNNVKQVTLEELKDMNITYDIDEITPTVKSNKDNTCLVTAFFNIGKMENSNRDKSVDRYMKLAENILALDYNMFIVIEPEYYDTIFNIRKRNNLLHKTRFLPMTISDTGYFKYYDIVKNNIQINPYLNPNSVKDTPLYTMVSYSKFNVLEMAMKSNPFNSEYYGWIDFGIAHVADPFIIHLPEDDRINIMEIIHLYPDQVDTDEKMVNYSRVINHDTAADYFIGSKSKMKWLCKKFEAKVTKALSLKVAPYEENILSMIISDDPSNFKLYYGDFKGILSNFNHVVNSINTISKNIYICRSRKDDNAHIYEIGLSVLNGYLLGELEYTHYQLFNILNQLFVAGWYCNHYDTCDKAVEVIANLILVSPEMVKVYDSHYNVILNNMSFAHIKGKMKWPLDHNVSPCPHFLGLHEDKINTILEFYTDKS